MRRLDLPYLELSDRWLGAGLIPPRELLPVIEEKHELLRSVHWAHPDAACRACGRCCPTFPFTTRYIEYRYVVNFLEESLAAEQKRRLVEERFGGVDSRGSPRCPFHEEGRCLVYRARPLICRRSVAGESICLSYDQEVAYPAWTGREESFRFLAVNCLVNFEEEGNAYREIGLTVPGRGVLVMAPFEFWFLLELGRPDLVRSLEAVEGYRPVLRWSKG